MGVEDQDVGSPSASDLTDDTVHIDAPSDGAVDLDTVSPDSSSGTADEKFDLLSVVRKVVDGKADDADSSTAAETGEEPPEDSPASAPETVDPDNENYSDVAFHKHPRFQQLLAERREFKAGHDQYAKLTGFLQETGVSSEEAARALELEALRKTNPVEAWKAMKPMVQQLLMEAGELLPADLQQRVKQGELTREMALEMNRLKAAQTAGQRASQHGATVADQRAQQQAVQARVSAVTTWEQATRARDPDFDAKLEDLQKEILWMQKRDGVPADAAGAKKQLDAAFTAVNKRVRTSAAPRRQTTPVTGGRGAGGNNAPKPQTMLDVVKQAVQGASG